jgi:hypothetical protein
MKPLFAAGCLLAAALASSADPADAKTGAAKTARAAVAAEESGPIQRDHRKHGGKPGGGVRVCKSSAAYCLLH